MNFDVMIDRCDLGHYYAKLSDHPLNNYGAPRCPHCLVQGSDAARLTIASFQTAVALATDYIDAVDHGLFDNNIDREKALLAVREMFRTLPKPLPKPKT